MGPKQSKQSERSYTDDTNKDVRALKSKMESIELWRLNTSGIPNEVGKIKNWVSNAKDLSEEVAANSKFLKSNTRLLVQTEAKTRDLPNKINEISNRMSNLESMDLNNRVTKNTNWINNQSNLSLADTNPYNESSNTDNVHTVDLGIEESIRAQLSNMTQSEKNFMKGNLIDILNNPTKSENEKKTAQSFLNFINETE
jgi:hypothetical protein